MSESQIRFLFLALFTTQVSISAGFAQANYTNSGENRDAKSGETLIGATVYPVENPTKGVPTNA